MCCRVVLNIHISIYFIDGNCNIYFAEWTDVATDFAIQQCDIQNTCSVRQLLEKSLVFRASEYSECIKISHANEAQVCLNSLPHF